MLAESEIWAADRTHVVYGTVTIPTNCLLTIAEGAVVKFAGGGIISRGELHAEGVCFTDLADDSIGGDALKDGWKQPYVSYSIEGAVIADERTVFGCMKTHNVFSGDGGMAAATFDTRGLGGRALEGNVVHWGGVLAADETWSAGTSHVVYGTLTVPEGATLTIERGADVRFVGGGLTVKGTCLAHGVRFSDLDDCYPLASYVLEGSLETDSSTEFVCRRTQNDSRPDPGVSRIFRFETDVSGYRFAGDLREVTFAASWDDSSKVCVTETRPDGSTVVLTNGTADALGVFLWDAGETPGLYTLRHVTDTNVLEASFYRLVNASVHSGVLTETNVWAAGTIHVLNGNVTVGAGAELTIEEGAIVKAMPGAKFVANESARCIAKGVTFTHVADDSRGGDTLADGPVEDVPENDYMIVGYIEDDAATEYRYAQRLLNGTIAHDAEWDPRRVYVIDGTLTVADGVSLTIPKGTVVKFTNGSSLAVESGGVCIAGGAIFTHIDDDAAGGDTLGDGAGAQPTYDAYTIVGNVIDDDFTEYRYAAPITLSGTISKNTSWRSRGVFLVTGNLTIARGATLTIQPGAIVKFSAGLSLTVSAGATLNALGTRAAPIVFTSIKDDEFGGDTNGDGADTLPEPGNWDEIGIKGIANLTNVKVLWGGYGQYSNQGDAAVRCYAGANATLDGCVVKGAHLRLLGNSGGKMTVFNTVLNDGQWGWDGTINFVNGVVANCLTGANGGSADNSIFYNCASIGSTRNCCLCWNCGGTQSDHVADPKFLDPDNGDFRVADDSPCLDAGDTSVAPLRDYYGQPRVGEAADIGIYEIMPRYVASDVDLGVRDITMSSRIAVGDELSIGWTVENYGSAAAVGSRRDIVELIDANGVVHSLGEFVEKASIAGGGQQVFRTSFIVPSVAIGEARVRVTVNAYRDVFEGSLTANNRATSKDAVDVTLPELSAEAVTELSLAGGKTTAFAVPDGWNASAIRVFAQGGEVSALGGVGYTPSGLHYDVTGVKLDDGSLLVVVPENAGAGMVIALENTGSSMATVRMEAASAELLEHEAELRPPSESGGTGKIVASLVVADTIRQGREYVGSVIYENVGDGDALAPYLKICAPGVKFRLLGEEDWNEGELTLIGIADGDPAGIIRAGERFVQKFEYLPNGDSTIVLKTANDSSEGWRRSLAEIAETATIVNRRGRKVMEYCDLLRYADVFAEGVKARAVSGTLCDQASGRPLTGAQVAAFNGAGEAMSFDVVDGNGVFSLEGLSEGDQVTLRVLDGGFAEPMSVTVPEDGDLNGVRWIGTAGTKVTFSFVGVDEDEIGTGIQLSVRGFDAEEDYSVTVTNLNPVTLTVKGNVAHLYSARLRAGWEVNGFIDIQLGGEDENVLIDFASGAQVSGTVVDARGNGVIDVTVTLRSEDYPELAYTTIADVNGVYSFGCLPSGKYLVCVAATGYGSPAPVSVEVPECGELTCGNIALIEYGNTLTVKLFAVSVATHLQVIMDSGFVAPLTALGDDGETIVGRLPCGRGKVAFFDELGACLSVENPIFIAEGENVLETAVADARYIVACRAADANGKAVVAAWTFTSESGDGSVFRSGGDYAPTRLRATCYAVQVTAAGYKSVAFRRQVAGNEYIDVVLEADPDYLSKVEDQLKALSESIAEDDGLSTAGSRKVIGRVVGGGYDDYTGGVVMFRSSDGSDGVFTGLSADGWFVCPFVPDTATLVWVALADGTVFKVLRADAEASGWVLTVPDDLGEVTVEVVDDVGNPIANRDVTFVNSSGYSVVRKTDSRGLATTIQDKTEQVKVETDDGTKTFVPEAKTPEPPPVDPDPQPKPHDARDDGKTDEKPPEKIKLPKKDPEPVNVAYTPIVKPEELPPLQEYLVDMPIAPSGLGVYSLGWYDRYLKLLQSYLRQLDSLHKTKLDPNYPSCVAKKCTYNDRVWKQYSTCLSAARSANYDAQYELERAHMRARELNGSVVSSALLVGLGARCGQLALIAEGTGVLLNSVIVGVTGVGGDNLADQWNGLVIDDATEGLMNHYQRSMSQQIYRNAYKAENNAASFASRYARTTGALGTLRAGSTVLGSVNNIAGVASSSSELTSLASAMASYVSHVGQLTSRAISAAAVPYRECSSGNEPSTPHPDPEEEPAYSSPVRQVVSCDPNEVVGPMGEGDPMTERFMRPGEWMTYTVYFENASNATAGAQEVFVTNPLSEWLDLDSFEMGEVAYANLTDLGLVGLQIGSCERDLTGTTYRVQSNVELNKELSTVGWYLRLVDPTTPTGWPEDPFAGFLMPNDETHRGEGHLTYRIRVREDAPRNVVITNTASIVFDYNEAIETDPFWWNTAGWPLTLGEAVNNESLDWSTGGAMDWLPMWYDCAADGMHDAVVTGGINDTNSWISTTVEGPGTVSFAWCGELSARTTKLQFFVDGEVEGRLSGSNGWETVSVAVYGEGEHTLVWKLSAGRSGASADDFAALDCVAWSAMPLPPLAEALNTNLTWTTEGDVAWRGVPRDSLSCPRDAWAVASDLGDWDIAAVETRVYGSGVLRFDWAVSCEEEYDELVLVVDGAIRKGLTGDVDWRDDAVAIDGKCWHTVRWEYVKDEFDAPELVGDNCAMLDNVVWDSDDEPPHFTETTPVPVPFEEIDAKYKTYLDAAGGDYEAAALAVGKNGYAIWESYVAGLNPEDELSQFKVKIEIVNGEPKITWAPDLNENGTKNVRKYTTLGSENLGGEWKDTSEVQQDEKEKYRFFKVSVGMP